MLPGYLDIEWARRFYVLIGYLDGIEWARRFYVLIGFIHVDIEWARRFYVLLVKDADPKICFI